MVSRGRFVVGLDVVSTGTLGSFRWGWGPQSPGFSIKILQKLLVSFTFIKAFALRNRPFFTKKLDIPVQNRPSLL